jgi:hypothetical protein
MSAWWWVAIGLVAWLGAALPMGLLLGPFLRRCSQAREARDAQVVGALTARPQPLANELATLRHLGRPPRRDIAAEEILRH